MFMEEINELNNYYENLYFFQKWFFPRKLRVALNNYFKNSCNVSNSIIDIYQSVFDTSLFIRRIFYGIHRFFSKKLTQNLKTLGFSGGKQAQANFQALKSHEHPLFIIIALECFNTDLLNGDQGQANFQALLAHENPCAIGDALCRLNTTSLLNDYQGQANFQALMAHKDSRYIADVLECLNTAGLLKGEQGEANFQTLMTYKNPLNILKILAILNITGLLSGEQGQANFQDLIVHKNPWPIRGALYYLYTAGILKGEQGQVNFQALLIHIDLGNIVNPLHILNTTGLLSSEQGQANFEALMVHENTRVITNALECLNTAGLLSSEQGQANFAALMAHENIRGIANALECLNTAGLLSSEQGQANFAALMAHENIRGIANALECLNTAGLLNGEVGQTRFNALILHQRILNNIPWDRIPRNQLVVHFIALINLCAQHWEDVQAGRRLVEDYMNRNILNFRAGRMERALNQVQSTHMASVHLATDLTAWLLLHRYCALSLTPAQINEEFAKFTQLIGNFGAKTGNSSHHAAALRALKRLNDAQVDLHLDCEQKERCLQMIFASDLKEQETIKALLPALMIDKNKLSLMSLKHFIVLIFYTAEENGQSLETICQAFVDALYEIQRGYNLDKLSPGMQDQDKDADLAICYGGTANKFCELLSSLSPLIQFIYINEESINLKLKQILIHNLRTQLESLAEQAKLNLTRKAQLSQIISALGDDTAMEEFLSNCWNENETKIKELLVEEFKLYSLAHGDQKILQIMQQFKKHSLPYLGAINENNNNYSAGTKAWFTTLSKQQMVSLESQGSLTVAGFFPASSSTNEQLSAEHNVLKA